ncbi:hypothetical protein, partial [Moorena sp. SIO4G3]|uniref:hypothetical protein n=1 Tax=Moorena sp. SIO4G3 TaxID=2607821 RepID=UPI0025E78988
MPQSMQLEKSIQYQSLPRVTGQLIVKDGAGVSASTASEGDGGDVNITTGELIISDGAQVSA